MLKRYALPHALLFLTSLLVFTACSTKAENKVNEEKKTNIIFILADDLGYGDLGFLGQQYIETPNIDRLAKEGMFFTNHYSGATVCAPSRSAFLTGLHTGHTPIRGNKEVKPEGQFPMPDSIPTVAMVMERAGYKTGAFGKWGLGFIGTTGDPGQQGFEQFYGYNCQRYAHRYYPAHLWHNSEKIILEGNGWMEKTVFAPDVIQKETISFIESNKDKPFFLFMPIVLPHAELAAPDDEIFQKYRAKFADEKPFPVREGSEYGPDLNIAAYQSQPYPHAAFAAMVERIDVYLGEVLAKLDELGLSENTLIIFASDNGAHQEGGADPDFFNSNGPYRGHKRDLYEGGVRTPMIAWWPGKIKAGSQSDHISAFWDLLPTFADVAGAKVPNNIDGISFLPALLDQKDQREHEFLYWEFHEQGGKQAVRQGKWKAVKLQIFGNDKPTIELYDLSVDVSEENNIAAEHPGKVKELEGLMNSAHTPNSIFGLLPSERK
ncbi:arylsulfatase [Algoriphagus antarcticus]|uniref:Arylsulfatase A-like enzyme n=1 Tax=Algoriphagus antarcticus TaxID=238540 RepID=A0A3E0DIM5_9BACT|nr:arylsulfatase [Algoriphagus antarcticus]REG82563.1 arylsulfatase A-like enzyme [Algoriphagus antarcticus]